MPALQVSGVRLNDPVTAESRWGHQDTNTNVRYVPEADVAASIRKDHYKPSTCSSVLLNSLNSQGKPLIYVHTYLYETVMTAKSQQRVKRVRRYDPERKEKIVDKAFELIAECGVAGITHRLIAGRAGVPLGSMTYHFKNMDELLFLVFSHFAQKSADFMTSRMDKAENPDAAIECFASMMTDREWVNRQNMAVLYEFYSLATREPAYRQILTDWSNATRHSLERFFPPATARAFDVCIEGVLLQNFLNPEGGLPYEEIIALLKRISATEQHTLAHAPAEQS